MNIPLRHTTPIAVPINHPQITLSSADPGHWAEQLYLTSLKWVHRPTHRHTVKDNAQRRIHGAFNLLFLEERNPPDTTAPFSRGFIGATNQMRRDFFSNASSYYPWSHQPPPHWCFLFWFICALSRTQPQLRTFVECVYYPTRSRTKKGCPNGERPHQRIVQL